MNRYDSATENVTKRYRNVSFRHRSRPFSLHSVDWIPLVHHVISWAQYSSDDYYHPLWDLGLGDLGSVFCFCIRLAHPLSIQERIYSIIREACIHVVHVLNKKTKYIKKIKKIIMVFFNNPWQLKDNKILKF